MIIRIGSLAALAAMALCTFAPAHADHSWGNYHWARKTPSFNLTVINSTTSAWDDFVRVAVASWSDSGKLDLVQNLNGSTSSKDRRACRSAPGQIQICNLAYGQNGWLGIAGISVDTKGHITTGYTKLNDTYFAWSYYNKTDWKQSVACQELGHNIGLDHQDETFDNTTLYSCMDYQDPPFEYPNPHDYSQLDAIYEHVDTYNSYSAGTSTSSGSSCTSPSDKSCAKAADGNNGDIGWGMSIGRRGQSETFVRTDPDGTRHITHVIWVVGH